MGKRKNEQPPGGDGKCHLPKTKRSLLEDSEATADDGLDATGPAQTTDDDGKPKSRGQTAHGSTGGAATNAPRSANGDGEAAAPERSQAGERVPSPSPQEGRDTGVGGGGRSPEAAAPGAGSQPESPQQANSVVEETEEDQPAATAERHGSAGEELDAETPTHRGTGNIGDSPERGSAAPARGEGAAGGEMALPADTPGRSTGSGVPAAVPDPRREEGVNRSEPGERRGDADQSRELPHAVNAEEKESGSVSESAAGGEHRENVSEERPRATGTDDTVKNAAEPWCSPASGIVSVEVSGVCVPSADPKAEAGTAEPESAGAAGAVDPVSQPLAANASPRKTSGEADRGREEAGEGEPPPPETSSAPDPAVPAGGNAAGAREGEGLAEARRGAEHADVAPRTAAQPPTRSGDGIAGSAPADTATPGPAPTGTAQPPAAGAGSAVGTDRRDGARSAGEPELHRGLEDKTLELPPQPPLPAADRREPAVPGRQPRAAAGRSRAEESPPLTEGNGPDPPQPGGEEPEGPRAPACREDATDVICGLILELSNLNRLAMSAHRGLEALRRPKPRRSRRPVPPRAGRRWKET